MKTAIARPLARQLSLTVERFEASMCLLELASLRDINYANTWETVMQYQLDKFESRLKELFDEIDDYLEDTYGDRYPLHPSRARRGGTSNKESNGLFNIGASFSAGYGSQHGRGYVIQVDMVTLSHVPNEVEDTIEEEVADIVRRELSHYFPSRNLEVRRDRNTFKITGDLSLGSL